MSTYIYRLITFHILTLKPASVQEGLPFLLPVPLLSTSLRLNIHFFQPSFSVGLCIWSFYINDTIWQWISGKGTISSGWEYWCIESQDLAGTLKNRDLRASLLMDALCSFLSMMPCPCSAGSPHQRAQLLSGKFLCTAQDFTPSWCIPTSSFINHLSIRWSSLNVFHLFPAGNVISMAHPYYTNTNQAALSSALLTSIPPPISTRSISTTLSLAPIKVPIPAILVQNKQVLQVFLIKTKQSDKKIHTNICNTNKYLMG